MGAKDELLGNPRNHNLEQTPRPIQGWITQDTEDGSATT